MRLSVQLPVADSPVHSPAHSRWSSASALNSALITQFNGQAICWVGDVVLRGAALLCGSCPCLCVMLIGESAVSK